MTDEDRGPDPDGGDVEAKRVFADQRPATTLLVATGTGLARVSVSDDVVGEFTLVHTEPAADVAAADGSAVVAGADDVLVTAGERFVETGFGPATAVDVDDVPVAAGGGRVARLELPDGREADPDRSADPAVPGPGEWSTVGELSSVRAIDGDLVAAATGVHRLDGTHVGLDGALDVAAAGPLAATGEGLYALANGWMRALEGSFRVAAAHPGGPAHAATAEALYVRPTPGGSWATVDLPVAEPVADVAYGPPRSDGPDDDGPVVTYVATEAGTVLVDAGDGWRRRSIGLPDVGRVAVLEV